MKSIKISEVCYYLFFLFLLCAKGIGLYDGQPLFKAFLLLALAAWGLKMLLTAYTTKEFCIISFLVLLSGLVYVVSGEKGAFLYVLMITGLKNISLKKLFSLSAWVFGTVFLLFTWLNAIGLLDSPFLVHDKYGFGPLIRWGLGYSHPNVLHVTYLVFVMLLVYSIGEKFNWKYAFGFMLGNILVFLYSLSSTGVIVVSAYLVLCVYGKYRKNLGKIERLLISMVLPLFILLSLLAPVVLSGRVFDLVNKLVNTRLNLAKYFLTLQPPTLFGTRVANIITNKLTMDNSYVNAFVTYGIVLFVVIVTSYILLIRKYSKEQKKSELCIILACLLGGVTEPFLFNTSFKNLSLLFMKDILFEEEKEARIKLLAQKDREFHINIQQIADIPASLTRQTHNIRKGLALTAVLGCAVGMFLYGLNVKKPDAIIIPERLCDYHVIKFLEPQIEEVTLLPGEKLPENSEQYVTPDTEENQIIFSGNLINLERIRGFIVCGLSGAFILCIGTSMILIAFQKRREHSC